MIIVVVVIDLFGYYFSYQKIYGIWSSVRLIVDQDYFEVIPINFIPRVISRSFRNVI